MTTSSPQRSLSQSTGWCARAWPRRWRGAASSSRRRRTAPGRSAVSRRTRTKRSSLARLQPCAAAPAAAAAAVAVTAPAGAMLRRVLFGLALVGRLTGLGSSSCICSLLRHSTARRRQLWCLWWVQSGGGVYTPWCCSCA